MSQSYLIFKTDITLYYSDNILWMKSGNRVYRYDFVTLNYWTSLKLLNTTEIRNLLSRLSSTIVSTNDISNKAETFLPPDYKQIEMYRVNSSNIKRVGYDLTNLKLYVEYSNSDVYEYSNVDPTIWNGISNAESKGSFVHWMVKINKSSYPYRKLSGGYNLVSSTKRLAVSGTPHPEGYLTGFESEL